MVLRVAGKMVHVKLNDEEQSKNAPVVNGCVNGRTKKIRYRPANRARVQIRRWEVLGQGKVGSLITPRNIQLARRIRGERA